MHYLLVLFQFVRNSLIKSSFVQIVTFCINRTLRIIGSIRKMDSSKPSNITSTTTITFKADDKKNCFETNKAKNVVVVGSCDGTHDHGSSKIKLKNIVDYKWKEKNYSGRLIAVHLDGHHVAYAIKVNNKEGIAEGMVRVLNSENNNRELIKGMSNEVLDLQFAHMKSIILLGCIEKTALHVHKVEDTPEKVVCSLMVKIEDPIAGHVPLYDKIKWCPFVPEEEDEVNEFVGQELVWFRGNVYQCYSVKAVTDAYGIGQHLSKNVIEGSLKQTEVAVITGASFSPDGSTLGVCLKNGLIRFYQIYFHTNETNPRCLHKWIPHGGKAINNLFFLDDHTTANPEKSLWKYAITTSDNNTELKVWCCSMWECLQTVNFKSANVGTELILQAEIDHKSSYLMMSDMKNRALYVLQIEKPQVESANSSAAELSLEVPNRKNHPVAFIKSISEFPLSSPILSFALVDAAIRRYKCNYNDNYLLDDMEEYDEDTNSLICVLIRLYLVQPKSVQECRVFYQPTVSVNAEIASTMSGSYKETTLDLTNDNVLDNFNDLNMKTATENAVNAATTSATSPKSNQSENMQSNNRISLMTPNSFNSPAKITPEGVSMNVLSTIRMLAKVQSPPDAKKKTETVNMLNLVNNKSLEELEMKVRKSVDLNKQVIASSNSPNISVGSSPSREVQEILSVKEDSENILNDEFYDDNNDLLDENDGDSVEKIDETEPFYNAMGDEQQNELPPVTNKVNKDWPKIPQVPEMPTIPNSNTFNNVNNNNDLSYKLDQVIEFMQTQACQISELRNAIELKNNAEDSKWKTMSKSIEFGLTKTIEECLGRYEREQKKKMDSIFAERDKQNRELRDSILHSVAQLITSQVNERLPTIIMNEMPRQVLPIILGQLEKIKSQILGEISQKLRNCDQVIRDSVTNMSSSKASMEAFGNSVALGVQAGLQKTYTDSLKTTIIPSFERTSEELFRQIQTIFLQGTKSYTKQFEAYMSQYQPMHDETTSLLLSVPDQLKSVSEATITSCTNRIQTEMLKDLKALQVNLAKSLREAVKKEMQRGFESQSNSINESVLSAVHSQVHTPAPTLYDVQEQIKQNLAQGHINAAFHQALVANDLNLVEFILEKADYKQVFNPCPLQQPVLLSLIQQIGADMNNHNDLKQRYLSDAIVSLDMHDATTREHAPQITRELYQHCQNFIASNPQSPLIGGIKMLMMAVQGFKAA
ncbi:Enhancer of mRNA-decapping protein 4 like [Pseudolycoriella hygida]|uniref:Enhancer of mRNA-decapping protein 4 like n=1 Tax=Pseudolycoriella hygida TaxID=35572 RepID=A0A9Q0NGI1_9DIPT|nr:Enhancer of mRNA-decapping protein 4 like [Pseudolycoriella hygida]